MSKKNLLPCDRDICPLNKDVAIHLGFLQLHGTESEKGKRIIAELEQNGVKPEILIECVRLNCHHLTEVHRESALAMEIIMGAGEIMRNKKH